MVRIVSTSDLSASACEAISNTDGWPFDGCEGYYKRLPPTQTEIERPEGEAVDQTEYGVLTEEQDI